MNNICIKNEYVITYDTFGGQDKVAVMRVLRNKEDMILNPTPMRNENWTWGAPRPYRR